MDMPPVQSPQAPHLVQCSASANLKFLIFVRRDPHFHFVPSSRDNVGDPDVVLME